MKRSPAACRWLLCLLTSVLCTPGLADAHAFHVSWAELDHNPETEVWELALRVTPEDLERALGRAGRKNIRLGRTPDIDERILAYLEKKLIVRGPEGQACVWRWVGKEVAVQEVWIYAELLCPSALTGGGIENRMFLELDEEQVNTLVLRENGNKTTLTFHRGQPRRDVAPPAPEELRVNPSQPKI